MKAKHFIHTGDFSREELEGLLHLAREFKAGRGPRTPLKDKQVALMFFNSSLRTRCTMEVGIRQLGGEVTTLDVGQGVWNLETREGVTMDQTKPEHLKDAARVLSRLFDAVAVRAFPGLENLEEDMADSVLGAFRKYSTKPVLNMESSLYHPFQALADMMTIQEKLGAADGMPVALLWVNHIKPLPAAVPDSFAVAAVQLGCRLKIVAPPEFPLPDPVLAQLGKKVEVAHDLSALRGAKVLYAKSWGSPLYYGRREEERRLRAAAKDWIVTPEVMARTDGAIFMHCMPIRRNVEAQDAVLESSANAMYDQAENRLHVQKAVLAELVR